MRRSLSGGRWGDRGRALRWWWIEGDEETRGHWPEVIGGAERSGPELGMRAHLGPEGILPPRRLGRGRDGWWQQHYNGAISGEEEPEADEFISFC